jgi:hypothetical protein
VTAKRSFGSRDSNPLRLVFRRDIAVAARRRSRLPLWLSVFVIFALSALCWAALISIITALL